MGRLLCKLSFFAPDAGSREPLLPVLSLRDHTGIGDGVFPQASLGLLAVTGDKEVLADVRCLGELAGTPYWWVTEASAARSAAVTPAYFLGDLPRWFAKCAPPTASELAADGGRSSPTRNLTPGEDDER